MDRAQIEAIEISMREEHLRDLEALSRLKRFLPNGVPKTQPTEIKSPKITPTDYDDEEEPVATLRGTVGETMASDPKRGWSGQRMLAHLRDVKFPLQAKKPVNSVVIAMNHWVKRECAVVARRGKGRMPNIIKWKPGVPFPKEVRLSDSLQFSDE